MGFEYSITFTDDYSGVIFVCFLCNKTDVTATEKFLCDCSPIEKVTAPYSPHQNRVAERQWRTLFEMRRYILLQAKLPKMFWPYAVMAAAHIRNRCFNQRLSKAPYEAVTGRKPNISNMREFGAECYVYSVEKKKLDARSTKGTFVGYDKSSPAYLVYYPETGKVMKHRVVKFVRDNGDYTNQEARHGLILDDNNDDDGAQNPQNTEEIELKPNSM